jgi:hypothetical protein
MGRYVRWTPHKAGKRKTCTVVGWSGRGLPGYGTGQFVDARCMGEIFLFAGVLLKILQFSGNSCHFLRVFRYIPA